MLSWWQRVKVFFGAEYAYVIFHSGEPNEIRVVTEVLFSKNHAPMVKIVKHYSRSIAPGMVIEEQKVIWQELDDFQYIPITEQVKTLKEGHHDFSRTSRSEITKRVHELLYEERREVVKRYPLDIRSRR